MCAFLDLRGLLGHSESVFVYAVPPVRQLAVGFFGFPAILSRAPKRSEELLAISGLLSLPPRPRLSPPLQPLLPCFKRHPPPCRATRA